MSLAFRLLTLPGKVVAERVAVDETRSAQIASERQTAIQRSISERNARCFEAEVERTDGWADDLKVGIECALRNWISTSKMHRCGATAILTLEDKLVAAQKQVKALETQRSHKRRSLFEAQVRIDAQRDAMISKIEVKARCSNQEHQHNFFEFRGIWHRVREQ
ncbi:MAG: hypothetical protein L0H70_10410 [Xanthomonadales bacterium]|nr:hypothetical protein [Xanthomonadales bacterium]